MTTEQLINQIKSKKSFLCIGLDVDLDKIPQHLLLLEDPIFEFNKAIIDVTHDLCVSYKPNTAFYEAYGIKGWQSLQKTIAYLNENYPEIFTIADAKRGDIGNTSTMYAKAFFEDLNFDSVTVAPYMGRDSVEPFLAFEDKHTIMLALTSNEGAFDFLTLNFEHFSKFSMFLKLVYKVVFRWFLMFESQMRLRLKSMPTLWYVYLQMPKMVRQNLCPYRAQQ